MIRTAMLCVILAGGAFAQDPFQPMDMGASPGVLNTGGAREDWARVTNQRLEMTNKRIRVAQEGLTAIVLNPDAEKPRHAKPILLGKGEHELLLKSIAALGFTRIVVRNPGTGKEWGARIVNGKPVLD